MNNNAARLGLGKGSALDAAAGEIVSAANTGAAVATAATAATASNSGAPTKVRTWLSAAKNLMGKAGTLAGKARSYLSNKAGNAGRFLTQKARNAHNRVLGGRNQISRTRLGQALNKAKGYGSSALATARNYGKAAYTKIMNKRNNGSTRFGRGLAATSKFFGNAFTGLKSRFSRNKPSA